MKLLDREVSTRAGVDGVVPERVAELARLERVYENVFVRKGGWSKFLVYTQEGGWPVWAYRNTDEEIDEVLIGDIHGSEEIGGEILADMAPRLIDTTRRRLVIPVANKWGMVRGERYSPNGKSVGDTDEFFGVSWTPPTPESEKFIQFLLQQKIKLWTGGAGGMEQTRVLDIHEDGMWEDGLDGLTGRERQVALAQIHRGGRLIRRDGAGRTYVDSAYSYMYASSRDWSDSNLVTMMVDILHRNGNGLPRSAHTRFPGEDVVDGVVWNPEDRSIDHLLAFLGAKVITTEITRRAPHDPSLAYRLKVQRQMVEAFLENG